MRITLTSLTLIFLFSSTLAAQTLLKLSIDEGCNYDGSPLTNEAIYGFESSNEAEEVIDDIMNLMGLPSKFVIMIVLALCLLPVSFAAAEIEVVHGRAVDDQGRLAYLERHTITYRQGRIVKIKTIYTDADRIPIGKTETDFSKDSELGNYDFQDDRLDEFLSLTPEDLDCLSRTEFPETEVIRFFPAECRIEVE